MCGPLENLICHSRSSSGLWSRNVVFMSRCTWTFLTNHGHVLVCLAADQEMLLRDVASRVGITERAVQQIVGDLEGAGIIARTRVGRRNQYLVRREERFRHPLESGVTVGDFVDLVAQASRSSSGPEGEAVGEKTSLHPALRLVDVIQPVTASGHVEVTVGTRPANRTTEAVK